MPSPRCSRSGHPGQRVAMCEHVQNAGGPVLLQFCGADEFHRIGRDFFSVKI